MHMHVQYVTMKLINYLLINFFIKIIKLRNEIHLLTKYYQWQKLLLKHVSFQTRKFIFFKFCQIKIKIKATIPQETCNTINLFVSHSISRISDNQLEHM